MSSPVAESAVSGLLARTVEIGDPGPLLDLLPPEDSLAWVSRGDGMVGWGRAATFTSDGPSRFDHAADWWREVTGQSIIRDEVGIPGSGLIAFGTFTFSDDNTGPSSLIVPEVVVGRRDGRAWLTVIGNGIGGTPLIAATEPPTGPTRVAFADGQVSPAAWQQMVADAVLAISEGALEKVVLARDLVATLEGPLDVRAPLTRLAADYPRCWTFHVDGFFGSTPEMLVRLERGLITSRVLAGTIRRTGDDTHDLALAASLARSSKDLGEHEYAVRSVADALASHCSGMNVPEAPFVLHLPNVMHLATDVTAVVRGDVSSLTLAGALHPSAAVGGTPHAEAVALIEQIEGLDRGRYAGPVGWIDADGDGEWGIGLRSASIEDGPAGPRSQVRLYAGCGIVADSVPVDELAEADAKLVPVRDALTP